MAERYPNGDSAHLPPKKKLKTFMPFLENYKTRLFTKLRNRGCNNAQRCQEILLQIDPRKPFHCSVDVQRALLEVPRGQELLHDPSFIALLLEVDEEQSATAEQNVTSESQN